MIEPHHPYFPPMDLGCLILIKMVHFQAYRIVEIIPINLIVVTV